MVVLQGVSKTYAAGRDRLVEAVHAVDLAVDKGEFVVITGRSGCGKTTLLNLIAGLARPTSGAVLIEGRDIWELSDVQRSFLRNRTFGFVFQYPSLMPSLTVLENVLLPTIFFPQNGERSAQDRARALLEIVGLADKSSVYPRQLSAGQQQRAVIARSLVNDPRVLLADEPTSNLDEQSEKEVISLFQEVHASRGITVLLVTHASQLVPHGTRRIQMSGGAIGSDSGQRKSEEHVRAAQVAKVD
jgi:ABC-type lipoprotein export system ATPase subunit